MSREALLDAIDRASLVAEDHIPIRLSLSPGGVELSVSRQDVGGETEHVEAEYVGEEMTIAFNSRYLNDGVNAVEEEHVVLDVLDPSSPESSAAERARSFCTCSCPSACSSSDLSRCGSSPVSGLPSPESEVPGRVTGDG